MKKKLILLPMLFLLTGCNVLNLNNNPIDVIVDNIISNKKVTNVVFEGYKYYIPKGIKYIDKKDYNAILKDKNNNYYLYIDAIAYYHKTALNYQKDYNAFYYKEISRGSKKGFIEIMQKDNLYNITIVYNYGKIEVTSKENNLNETIAKSMIMLSSITFNDNTLATLIGENALNYKTENFTLFKDEKDPERFSSLLEEYSTTYDFDETIYDEDNIFIEEGQ